MLPCGNQVVTLSRLAGLTRVGLFKNGYSDMPWQGSCFANECHGATGVGRSAYRLGSSPGRSTTANREEAPPAAYTGGATPANSRQFEIIGLGRLRYTLRGRPRGRLSHQFVVSCSARRSR